MGTIPEYTLGHDKVIAALTTGSWEVSYPGYPTRTEVRHGATRKSYGLRWDTGCDLRVQGKAFTVDPHGVIDGYDKADGRHFVRYTPLPEAPPEPGEDHDRAVYRPDTYADGTERDEYGLLIPEGWDPRA